MGRRALLATSWVVLGLGACAEPEPEPEPVDDTGEEPPALEGIATEVGIGLALVQAPAMGDVVPPDAPACAGATVVTVEGAPAYYAALAPLWDESGLVRPAQIVHVADGACKVVASLSDEESEALLTGERADVWTVPGVTQALGLVLFLAPMDEGLALFTNLDGRSWRIDPATGTVATGSGISQAAAGIASDGAGGLWLTSAAFASASPPRLWHLDGASQILSAHDLPFERAGYALPGGAGSVEHDLFRFNPVAVTTDDHVWCLDSATGTLADVTSGETWSLHIAYPTGIAAIGRQVFLSAGVLRYRTPTPWDTSVPPPPEQQVLQAPAVWAFDRGTSGTPQVVELPAAPGAPWDVVGMWDSYEPVEYPMVVPADVFLPLASLDDRLVLADPALGRLFLVQ